jgi:hypothetical protein
MPLVALALGLAIAVLGMLSIVSPDSLVAMLRHLQTPAGLYFGAGFRLVLGISLFLSAPGSRHPDILRVLGPVFIVAGLILPLFGLEFFRSAIDTFLSLGDWAAHLWGLVALVFGLFICYAVAPRQKRKSGI